MVDLPKKKVGLVACSGEELVEGTITRQAALKVLEQLRPDDTVTICLPLFLAGGEGDRAFARFYPTIAIDGCTERCAARATELYSGKPAESLVVADLVAEHCLEPPQGRRRLNDAGQQAVDLIAEHIALMVDRLLNKGWDRRVGIFININDIPLSKPLEVQATCSCGSGIPVQDIQVGTRRMTIVALPLIFAKLHTDGRLPTDDLRSELLENVRIYNPIPDDSVENIGAALLQEYKAYCQQQESSS